MDQYINGFFKAILTILVYVGAVISASALITLLSEWVTDPLGYLVVGIVLMIPGSFILGLEKLNSIEIHGVKLKESENKNE